MHVTSIPPNEIVSRPVQKPPSYGGPQRDGIGSIVDQIVHDLCQRIAILRQTLDQIEQRALESAAIAKGSLSDHVAVCARLNDEIGHMQTVVTEIHQEMNKQVP